MVLTFSYATSTNKRFRTTSYASLYSKQNVSQFQGRAFSTFYKAYYVCLLFCCQLYSAVHCTMVIPTSSIDLSGIVVLFLCGLYNKQLVHVDLWFW